jgi:hypothetical protein
MWNSRLLTLQLLSFLLLASAAAAAAPCVLSPTSPSVTICSPLNGATVNSPVTLTAGTTDNSNPVTAMIAYVDNVIAYKVSTNQLSTSLSLTAGTHNVTVNAWDSSGAVFKTTVIITVSGTGTPPVSVIVAPSAATLAPGATQQFSATVLNTVNTGETWSVDGFFNGNATVGTISTAGLYKAPAINGTHNVVATSAADTSKSDTAIVTVTSGGGGGGACSPASGPPSVTICKPAAGATVTSPVQISAVGSSATPITKMLAYIDSVLEFQSTTSSSINTSVPIANGSHSLTVQFYNGAWVKQSENFLVATGLPIKVAVSPSTAVLAPKATQQFTASVTGSSNTAVNWSVDAHPGGSSTVGTVSITGLYTAPAMDGVHTVTATSQASSAASASAAAYVSGIVTPIPANVLTWHHDNERTGWNQFETTLTTANVDANQFGKLFSYLVDGYIYAQPLYVSNLTIAGAVHNVVFVATENDSVYAFNADSFGTGAPLWQRSLLKAGETPLTGASIKPVLGVTSTPVIDLASKTMYVVSVQKGTSPAFFRLHALDLGTGAEKFGGPVVIKASVPGTNSDSVNGVVSLTTSCVQRSALLLADETVFMGFGGCHSGWLLSYNAQTLAQTGVFNASPDLNGEGKFGGAGGIWMGGGGPAADTAGNIYVTTGNGPYDGLRSFSDSVLKFNAQLKLLDHFTPYDWAFLDCNDSDLSAGGLLLIPGTTQALVGGKTGEMFLVNTANLGGLQTTPGDLGATQALWFEQDKSPAYPANCTDNKGVVLSSYLTSYQIYGTGAFFNNSVYLGITPSLTTVPGPVRQFAYAGGKLTPGPITPDSIAPNTYGSTPYISANGVSNGIVWVLDHGHPIQEPGNVAPASAILRAYEAGNLSKELYNSAQNAADAAGYGIKFTSPIVANGKVFIGTAHDPVTATNPRGELDVYGLKP